MYNSPKLPRNVLFSQIRHSPPPHPPPKLDPWKHQSACAPHSKPLFPRIEPPTSVKTVMQHFFYSCYSLSLILLFYFEDMSQQYFFRVTTSARSRGLFWSSSQRIMFILLVGSTHGLLVDGFGTLYASVHYWFCLFAFEFFPNSYNPLFED